MNEPAESKHSYYGFQTNASWVFYDCVIDHEGRTDGPFDGPAIPGIHPVGLCVPQSGDSADVVIQRFHALLEALLGSANAIAALGILFSYAAAPELLATRGGTPGLWLFGKRAYGKTMIGRWLAAMWGASRESAVRMPSDSKTLSRLLRQYCCLPLLIDEYRHSTEPIDALLRSAFDRTPKGTESPALTVPIICGECTSDDAATRSRFIHIDMDNRPPHVALAIIAAESATLRQLPSIGLRLLQRRAQFCNHLIGELDQLDLTSRDAYIQAVAHHSFMAGMQTIGAE